MKSFFWFVIAMIWFCACTKDDHKTTEAPSGRTYKGSMIALMNDSPWNAYGEGYYDSLFHVSGAVFIDSVHQYMENVLRFTRMHHNVSWQRVNRVDYSKPQAYGQNMSAIFFTADPHGNYDAGGDVYDVLANDSLSNYFQITRLSRHDSEVAGIFSVTLVRTSKVRDSHYPDDTIRFRQGTFNVRIQ